MIYLNITLSLILITSTLINLHYSNKYKKLSNNISRKNKWLLDYANECKSMYDNLLKDCAVDIGMSRHQKFDFYYHDMTSLLRNISAELVENYNKTYADNRKNKL